MRLILTTSELNHDEHVYFLYKILQVLYKKLFTKHDRDNIKAIMVQSSPNSTQQENHNPHTRLLYVDRLKNTGSPKALRVKLSKI